MLVLKSVSPFPILREMEDLGIYADRQTYLDETGNPALVVVAARGPDACRRLASAYNGIVEANPDAAAFEHIETNVIPLRRSR